MRLTFEHLENGRWYVVLPEYPGDFDDLEMVENSDNMLDALTEDGLYVTLDVDLDKPDSPDCFRLDIEAHDEDGAFYDVKDCDRFSGIIWLCNVVHDVFGDHPETIYCTVVE